MWALNYYLTQLSFGCQSSCQQTPRELETRCGREGHTRPRGVLGKAPMEWTPRPLVEHLREQERHNVMVITVGSKYEVYVRYPAPSHANLTNKVRGKYNCKEVFLRRFSCVFLPASFIRASVVYHASVIIASVCIQYIYVCNTMKAFFNQIILTAFKPLNL